MVETNSLKKSTRKPNSCLLGSTRTHVRLTPIAGIENLALRDRLQNSEHGDVDPRACHLLLGSLKGVRDLWGTSAIYIEKGRSSSDAIRLLLNALDDYALPLLKKYDNKENLIDLFTRMSESWRNDPDLIVFDARTKLLTLIDH